jgi:hypothetical protein
MGLVTTEVTGLEPLLRKLEDMTSTARVRKVGLKVLEPGAKAMKKAIAEEAPVNKVDRKGRQGDKPGNLKRGVRYKASRTKNVQYWGGTPALAAYIVGPFGKGTAHRHLIVSGHKLVGHNRFAFQGREGVKKGLSSEGGRTKPNPFVQRGIERAKEDVLRSAESEAQSAMEILTNG